MSIFKKNQNSTQATFFRDAGKTENITPGRIPGVTEPLVNNQMNYQRKTQPPANQWSNFGEVQGTTPVVNGGGLVDIPNPKEQEDNKKKIDDYDRRTQPSGDFGCILYPAPGPRPTPYPVPGPVSDVISRPVVAWLVCVKGPDKGASFELHNGYNYVGRNSRDIIIPGDDEISREKHMVISYDSEGRRFHLAPGDGMNAIYLNNAFVPQAQELKSYDVIRTGKSEYAFVAFCGDKFNWE